MTRPLEQELIDQIRGVTGALLVLGITFHYTMETWFLAWTLPLHYLVVYAVVGLTLVVFAVRSVGFRERDRERLPGSEPAPLIALDFAEILLQSFVASYTILLVLGIIDLSSSLNLAMRLGLIEVVPLGFGAALANRVFGGKADYSEDESAFPKNVAIFAVGSLFVAGTIAPTQEVELVAAHMDWFRHAVLVALTVVIVYLVLFELEFRGHEARVVRSVPLQVGTTFIAYFVGCAVSFLLLLGFGHFVEAGVAVMYQETVVLAFPASLGGAAAEVLI